MSSSHQATLQNSYGPEIAASTAPQAVIHTAPEALYPDQPATTVYSEQADKNSNTLAAPANEPQRRRRKVCGLPLLAFWGLVGLLVLVIALGVGLGVGLGVVNNRTSGGAETSSAAATVTPTSSAAGVGTTTATPTATSVSSSSSSSTIASTTTTTSTSAAATGASVAICQNAYRDYCTTISVPASSCSMCALAFLPADTLPLPTPCAASGMLGLGDWRRIVC